MATDFDFDGSFNEDAAEEGTSDEDFDEEFGEEEEAEEEPSGRRRNPLRLILLVLVILVLLCVVCFLGSRYLPSSISNNLPLLGQLASTSVPAADTPVLAPTDEAPAPVEPAEEPTAVPTAVIEPTDEASALAESGEEPTAAPTVVVEATEEAALVAEATAETTGEQDGALVEPTATTAPVPGPTATAGPTAVVAEEHTCGNNTAPTADANGPYTAMMGKGQAIVTFDGTNSSDGDGTIVSYEWDFGDGSPPESGESVTHGYSITGTFVATLTVTDDCEDSNTATAEVTISGPIPPGGNGTSVVPTPGPEPPASGTPGFCYRVQYGDTLSGVARRFGVAWEELAYVNKVGMGYFVITGQGLFIPVGQITEGPNVYEVQSEDTLDSVAYHCGLTAATLAYVNGLDINESLSPGQMLMIPPWRYR